MSNKKNLGLTRRASGLMALEQRFMFDGAAVADAVDTAIDLQMAAPAAIPASENLARAEARAEQLVTDFLKRPDAREQLFALFKGAQTGEQATPEWQAAVDQLLVQVEQGDLNVRVELRSAVEMQGAKGAFSATGTTGEATIYLNADWVATADSESVAIVLTEELGHYLDHTINGDADTAGDEGEVFARFVVNGTQPLPVSFDLTDNDHAKLSLDGQEVLAELAAFNFVNAYEMVYDLDNDSTSDGSGNITGGEDNDERWASKEQNLHYFNAQTSLGVVSISDGTNGLNFSGNDVSAIAVVINGTTHYGWISRPIKANGVVRGFYFWTDTRFTSLALAQADGNQDGDSTILNNRGFVFVVDQSWFTTQINAGTNRSINNAKDGNLGSITVANVGSSSDRVDSALNSVNSPVVNAAPTAVADNATGTPSATPSTGVGNAALEQGLDTNSDPDVVITASINGSGNVLSNDTDSNSDTLSVTTVSSKSLGTSATASTSGVNVMGQYGTLNIKSNGNWTYTPDNTHPAVNALLSGHLQEQFTYSISDGKGGSASATLTVQINGSNDAPVAADDYNIAKESTTTATTTTAITGFNATGNVLPNDTDVDAGDTKTLVGLSDTGSASAGTYNSSGASTLLTFTTNSNIGSVSLNSQIFWDHNGDGDGASATTPVALAVSNGAATPTYTPVTVTSKADGNTTGTTDIGLSATPTHYWNGTGWTAFTNIESQLTSGSRYFEFGAANGNVAANSAKGGVLVVGGAEVTVAINISNVTGTIYEGMTVSASNGGISVLPAETVVTKVNYDANGDITSIELSNDFNPKPNDPTGYSLTFGMPSSGNVSITTGYGRLELSTTGDYTYTPHTDNILISDGESLVEEFNYTMRDTAGATSSAKLYITVYGSGSNDPTLSTDNVTAYESGVGRNATTPATLTNDNTAFNGIDPTATGVLTNDTTGAGGVVVSYTKADGSSLTAAGNSLTGTYGALNIAANGTYSFVVDNANATVQALLPEGTLTETFIYKVTNTAGGVSYAKLNVSIQGTNDLPVAVADTAAVSEDGVLNATGNVLTNDTDVDAGDSKVLSRAGTSSANMTVSTGTTSANGLNVTGTYGTLTLGADGTYAYTLNNASAGVQNLTQGQAVNDVFTYEVKDTNGATATTTLTIAVTGANEAPINQLNGSTISSTASTSVTTAANTAIDFTGSKLLSVSDLDSNLSTIKLEVEHGVLSFTSTPSVVTLSASAGKSITISAGTQAQLNDALALLRYTPDTNFYGTDFLSINSADTNSARDIDGIAINIPTVTTATVSEPALSSGTNAASTAEAFSGTVNLATGQTIEVQQTGNILSGSGAVIGNWIVNTNGTFTVTLTAASSATSSSFDYVAHDSYGNAVDNTVMVTITDDDPDATANINTVSEGFAVTGNVLTNGTPDSFGADGAKVTSPTGGVIGFRAMGGDATSAATTNIGTAVTGLYGTLTLNADGNYSYQANSASVTTASDDVFVYSIEDADGSRSTATLTITVNDVVVSNSGLSVNSVTVNEASPYVVFQVNGPADQYVVLALSNGTANGLGVDYGSTLSSSNIEVSTDGGLNWGAYTNSAQLNGNGLLKVRTPVINDVFFENSETFKLLVSPVSAAAATLPLYDVNYQPISLTSLTRLSGTEGAAGSVYQQTNAITIDSQAIDVRMQIVAISNVTSSAEFVVDSSTENPSRFEPRINSSSNSGSAVDYSFTFYKSGTSEQVALKNFVINPVDVDGSSSSVREYVELSNLSSYQLGSGSGLTVTTRDAFTRFVGITSSLDGITFENTASFIAIYADPVAEVGMRLGVTGSPSSARLFSVAMGEAVGSFSTPSSSSSPNSVEGTATILDDGTGTVFDANGNATSTAPNDDRAVSVSNVTVNEASPYAVFTVTATQNQNLSLALANGTGAQGGAVDYGTATDSVQTPNLEYSLDGGSTWSRYTAAFNNTLTGAGMTSGLMVRTPITNDTISDNGETFTLTATLTGSTSVVGTATIADDGNGMVFNLNGTENTAAIKDDDRAVTVTSPTVNEASPYAVFTLDGEPGQLVSLLLTPGTAEAGAGKDYTASMEVSIDGGLSWTPYTTGNVALNGAGGTLLVRVPVLNDSTNEADEAFTLTATNTGGTPGVGTATIVDDGNGTVFNPNGTENTGAVKDDDRALTVNDITVNEASPYAVFEVSGAANQLATLHLTNVSTTSLTGLQISTNGGTSWSTYITGNTALNTDGKLLVRTSLTPEQESAVDDGETLTLKATNTGGTYDTGVGTIKDDGTGTIFKIDGTDDTTAPRDDDRVLAVNDVSINEGSPYAVFTVTGGNNQQLKLSLSNQNDDGSDLVALQYFDGERWLNYTANQVISLNSSGSLLVRVALSPEQEMAVDGPETFKLVATNMGGTVSTGGLGTINDNGTGDYFDENNNTATPAVPDGIKLDDDRALTVSSFDVNEGSPYAVFTVSGAAGQLTTLALDAGTATADGIDYGLAATGSDLQVWDGDSWETYNSGTTVALNSNGKLLVRAAVVNDSVSDNNETFKLSATNTGGTTALGTATIKDDGTGTLFTDGTPTGDSPTVNADGPFDDDRAITVSGLDDVSEGSNAIFTVTLPDGNTRDTEISLALSTGTAQADDYSSSFTAYCYVDDVKTALTISGGKVNLPAGVASFFVSVPTVQDTDFEGAENFSLTATITGGKNGADTSTILDDGTGRIYDDRGINATGPGDDDRPKPAPVLTPPPAPATAAPALTPLTPTPVPNAPQSFASTLAPLAPALVPVEAPAPLGDAVTSRSGVPIPVSETAPPGLSLYQGVTDQFVQSTDTVSKVSLPFDAFIHSNKDAVIQLEAKQADDSPLPNWVQFDPATGVFEVKPPKDFKGKLDLKVLARDDDGREAVAIFQMFVGEQTTDRPQSRESFTEKLRMAGKRPITLMRMVEGSVPAPAVVREAPAARAAAA